MPDSVGERRVTPNNVAAAARGTIPSTRAAQQQRGHAFVTNECVGKTHIPLSGSHDA